MTTSSSSRRRNTPDDMDDEQDAAMKNAKRIKLEKRTQSQAATATAVHTESNGAEDEMADDDEMEETAFRDESDIPEEVMNAAAAAAREQRKNRIGAASEAGVIKNIKLIDFMCHKHLDVDFGAKMNFLVGHNGSGKSAILTAIAIALGGKTAATGRGVNGKELIRTGADKATVILTLSNEGYGRYNPKDREYASTIIIERVISRNGTNEYKLRATKDGKILGKKKSEVDAICSTFSLDVDQPMTILTQDQARTFLSSADDQQLYKFFLRGTQLEAMSSSYEEVGKNIRGIESTIERMEADIPEKKHKLKELQKKVEATKQIAEQKAKQLELHGEHGWALVIEKEKLRDEYLGEMDDMDRKMQGIDDAIASVELELAPMDEQVVQLEQDIIAFQESKKPIEVERRKARAEVDAFGGHVHELKEVVKEHRGNILAAEQEIAAADREIARHRAQTADGEDSVMRRKEEDLRKHEELLERLLRDIPRKEEAMGQLSNERRQADEKVEEAQQQLTNLRQEINNLSSRMNNMNRQRTNELAAFGTGIEMVLQAIDNARWVGAKPFGPLGRYVKLNDFRYKDLIEANLGSYLCSFAIQNTRDKSQLLNILKSCAQRGYCPGFANGKRGTIPSVLVTSDDMFDYSRGDNSIYGETVMSKLTFTDEYVRRVLINQASIERNFVTIRQEDASREIDRLEQTGLSSVVVFSVEPHLIRQDGQGHGSARTKNASPVTQYRGSGSLFTQDIAQEIDKIRGQHDALAQQQGGHQAEIDGLKTSRNQIQTTWSHESAALDKTRKTIPLIQNKVEKLREEVREGASDVILAKEMAKQEANKIKTTNQVVLDGVLTELEEMSAKLNEATATLQDLQTRLDNYIPERKRRTDQMSDLTLLRQRAHHSLAHYKKSKVTAAEKKKRKQEDFDKAHDKVIEWTDKIAPNYPDRIQTKRAVADIANEEEKVKRAITAAEKRQGVNVDVVREQYIKAMEDLKSIDERKCQLTGLAAYLRRHLTKRVLWWTDMRTGCSIKVMSAFVENTNKRGFDGRIKFNHDSRKLHISMQTSKGGVPDPDAQELRKTAKHLSGGERSFSTVSFLLAMWESAAGPLRALDEWDVFLDNVNRKLAASMLIEGAKQSTNKQYILITPQDMQGLNFDGPDTKIIRMADPTRNDQSILPFQAARA